MALMHLPFELIDQSHLQGLIDAKSAEARTIEYKRQSYGGNDAQHTEFLADMSSFANAIGGDLVIGMAAKAGIPTAFAPFEGDADAELLRLEQMARGGLEPRIQNLQTKAVDIGGRGKVLIIRVPRSYRQPHRIIFRGKNRFWSRSSAGKFEPNVDELRALFTFAPQLAEQMRQFRLERVARITTGETPVRLLDSHCMILHVVPFTYFTSVSGISMRDLVRNTRYFAPLGTDGRRDWRINFDGFVTLSNSDEGAESQRAYVQIFHSGAIEAVASSIATGNQIVSILDIKNLLIRHVHQYLEALHECGIEPPFAVMTSLIGLHQLKLTTGRRLPTGLIEGQIADRDQLHFREVILEELPIVKQGCAVSLRPILDQLANAAGCVSAQSFDDLNN